MKRYIVGILILLGFALSFKFITGRLLNKGDESAYLTLKDVRDSTIANVIISNTSKTCISLVNCSNITIKNCRITNSPGVAISLYRCKNVTISNCYIENTSTGVYALESQGINVVNNSVKNVTGPFPRGQMVQFDDVTGPGNRVNYNRCENIAGKSNPEDAISMYKSGGTPTDPIQITGNLIRGGGPSKTGGGIMLGDNGGSYIIAKDNILVNPGQYGMAISGGTHIVLTHNKIYTKRQPFTNVGLYIWKQSNVGCAINTISYNEINWMNAAGKIHNSWNNGNCGNVAGWDTNYLNPQLNESILPAIILLNHN